MRVFVTGATGFVGSAVVQELISAGHQVLGLARSEESANSLAAVGAEVHRGDLEDLESLKRGAAMSDGVIHTGFIHDFTRFAEMCEVDKRVIQAIGSELAGSARPFVITSGIGILNAQGRLATEEDMPSEFSPNPRVGTELAANAISEQGVDVSIVRLPPSVHGEGDHGFVPILIGIARDKGVSVFKEEGLNRWPAVHRRDAAKVYRFALEQSVAGIKRYHAVAEEGVTFHQIAEAIGKGINVPVISKSSAEATEHFGWFAHFAGLNCAASSQLTRDALGWQPEKLGLIEDLSYDYYFKG